jgi:hypothetical protein
MWSSITISQIPLEKIMSPSHGGIGVEHILRMKGDLRFLELVKKTI